MGPALEGVEELRRELAEVAARVEEVAASHNALYDEVQVPQQARLSVSPGGCDHAISWRW